MDKIKVLVVDDSALMRKIISDMINSESDMETVDTARNGEDLLKKISILRPDVVTLDIEMPKMDGISALKELQKRKIDIPVIMLSSVSQRGTRLTMDCLHYGAFDFIAKPSGAISLDINKVKSEIIDKVRIAYNRNDFKYSANKVSDKKSNKIESNRSKSERRRSKIEAVVIGASTGGPKALFKVITSLPQKLGIPIFVVQHMPVGFTKAFAERLDSNSKIKVVEASDNMSIEKDVLYIAPGGFHMEVGQDKKIHLNKEPTLWGVRPAVDKLFISASKVYKNNLMSVVLTGMGKDGAQGTVEVKKRGGTTFSEDKSTCTIYGMPKAAYETGMVDEVISIDETANKIIKEVIGS